MSPHAPPGHQDRTHALRSLVAHLRRDDPTTGPGDRVAVIGLVEGEPGIGKTRLLDEVVRALSEGSAPIDVRRCTARRHDDLRPFGPLLDAFGLTVPTATPGRRSPLEPPAPLVPVVVDLVVAAAREASGQSPTVLVVDDLHWADPGTVRALAALVDLGDTAPLRVLLARRGSPTSPATADLLARCEEADLLRCRLAGLDDDAAHELAAGLAGGPPGPRLRERLGAAAGNPFLVEQIVLQSGRSGLLRTDAAGVVDLVPQGARPPDLGVVLQRMVDLEDRPGRVLRVLSLLDGHAGYDELAAGCGLDPLGLVDDVARAVEAGDVEESEAEVRLSHDLVRESVEAALPAASVPLLRRDLGHRLLAAGADPARAAAQFLRSGDDADPAAAAVLVAVAGEVLTRSPATAVDLFARADALAGPRTPVGSVARVRRLDALFWAGRLEEALLEADTLRAEVDPEDRLRVEETALRVLTILGRPAEALGRARDLPRDPGTLPWTEALTAAMAMFALELTEAEERAVAALAAAARHPDPDAEVLAHTVRAWVLNLGGYHAEAVTEAATAVRLADASEDGTGHRMAPRLFHGLALESAGESAAATETLQRGLVIAAELGTPWAVPFHHYAMALGDWNAGRFAEADAACEQGLAVAARQGIGLAAPWAHAVRAGVALHGADLGAAAAQLDAGDRAIASGGVQVGLDWLAWMRALHLEAGGDAVAGYDLLVGAWEVAESVQAASALTLFGPDLVRISVLTGRTDTARRVVEALEVGSRSGRDNVDAHLDRCRGLVEGDPALVGRARAVHLAGDRPVDVRLDDEAAMLVALRARPRDPTLDARLAEVVADCEGFGLRLVADRIRAAASLGGRAARPRSGWGSLTAAEQRVAGLVASGRTNAEVAEALGFSVRTVESHLYRTYAKLGVKNRTELALEHPGRAQS